MKPDGKLKNNATKDSILKKLTDLAGTDLVKKQKNYANQYSDEQHNGLFEALDQYLEKVVTPKPVNATDCHDRVLNRLQMANQSNSLDFTEVFNLSGIDRLINYINPDYLGMGKFYNHLFTYLNHERTKDSYEKVGKAWDEFANKLENEIGEKTNSYNIIGDKDKWSKNEVDKLQAGFNNLSSLSTDISTSFHQNQISTIKSDINKLVNKLLDDLKENIKDAAQKIDFKNIELSLESEYIDYSKSSPYIKDIFKEIDLDLNKYGEKQKRINVYYEDVLLGIMNIISLIIKLKSIEYSSEIPRRVYNIFINWFLSDDKIDNQLTFLYAQNLISKDELCSIVDDAMHEGEYIKKVANKIEPLLMQLYNRPDTPSIYQLQLNDESEDKKLIDLLSSRDKEELHSEFINVFQDLCAKQIKDGIEGFRSDIQRFFNEWPSKDLRELLTELFQVEGELYKKIYHKQKELLDHNYDEQHGQLRDYCSLISTHSDDIQSYIIKNKDLYNQVPGLESLLAKELKNMRLLAEEYKEISC